MAISNGIFCQEINQLTEFTMIAGAKEVLEYSVYNFEGKEVDLTSVQKIYLLLCRYGNPDFTVLKKVEYSLQGTNQFVITLEQKDTANLEGKYIQQPVLFDFKGQEYRFAQGIINILPAIDKE